MLAIGLDLLSMQVTTYMRSVETSATRSATTTRDRILEAAARIYGRDGLAGATTREIAREAGVNEVTLFRHFKSKERLLAAVVGKNFGHAGAAPQPSIPEPTDDLGHDLLAMARCYDRLLTASLPLLRTMIGEIHRHREHERQVFRGIFYPVRDALQARLKSAQQSKQLRADTDIDILSDLFAGMVFLGVLKRNTRNLQRNYANSAYLQAIVDLMLHGTASA